MLDVGLRQCLLKKTSLLGWPWHKESVVIEWLYDELSCSWNSAVAVYYVVLNLRISSTRGFRTPMTAQPKDEDFGGEESL